MGYSTEIVQFQRCGFAGGVTVEFAVFALRAGATEAELAQAATRWQEELQGTPGFLGRMLVQNEGGSYLDLFYWTAGAADGPGMADRARASRAGAEYLACLAAPGDVTPPPALRALRGVPPGMPSLQPATGAGAPGGMPVNTER